MDEPQVRSIEEAEVHIRSWAVRIHQLERTVRTQQKLIDTMDTPLWKKMIFILDGWPLFRVVSKPQWRPWHQWWIS